MAKVPKPPLTLVSSTSTDSPPPHTLGEHGRALWEAIMAEYRIEDRGGIELLAQACGAADRVEALRAAIDRDGEVIHTRGGIRAHPALRDELAGRAFICRTLERLGLNVEAIKPMGRPPHHVGWRGPNAD
jgi:hypothetical protein